MAKTRTKFNQLNLEGYNESGKIDTSNVIASIGDFNGVNNSNFISIDDANNSIIINGNDIIGFNQAIRISGSTSYFSMLSSDNLTTTNRTISLPDYEGTLVSTVNGLSADTFGNVNVSGGSGSTVDTTFDTGSTNPVENKEISKAVNSLNDFIDFEKLRYSRDDVLDNFSNLDESLSAYSGTNVFLIFTNTSSNLRLALRKTEYPNLLDDFSLSIRGGVESTFETDPEIYTNFVENYKPVGYSSTASTATWDIYEIDRVFTSPEDERYGTGGTSDYLEHSFKFDFFKHNDGYEEGTFSPTLTQTDTTLTATTSVAEYYKIGKKVFINIYIQSIIQTSGSTNSTLFDIEGLPFTVSSITSIPVILTNTDVTSADIFGIILGTEVRIALKDTYGRIAVQFPYELPGGRIHITGSYLTND